MSDELRAAFGSVLGPGGWVVEGVEGYATDWLGRAREPLLGVARPATVDEVSATLALAHARGVAVVPQGGNTSLCLGATPGAPGALVLSLERMARIEAVDGTAMTATVQAGTVLGALHERLEGTGLAFPLHLGAEGSARIGGLIATNAGGSHAARHGMMADRVLGLEVVLADGRVWNGLHATLKDNAGYALARLFCGSEGTLGVVTRAVLRLAPAARGRATALLAVADLADAVRLGARLRGAFGELVDALEFFTDQGLGWALEHVDGLTWPLDSRTGAYVLVELATTVAGLPVETMLEGALGDAFESGLVTDGVVATSVEQRVALWRLREELPEGQRREGAQLKHDVAVPVSAVADFVAGVGDALGACLPGVRVNPFGHLGDGNVHLNLSPPPGRADFDGAEGRLSALVYERVTEAGGSIAAEHGLGRTKVAVADRLRDPVERSLMAALKGAVDPAGIMNPGVVVSDPRRTRQRRPISRS